jgi:hypothetical protein
VINSTIPEKKTMKNANIALPATSNHLYAPLRGVFNTAAKPTVKGRRERDADALEAIQDDGEKKMLKQQQKGRQARCCRAGWASH